ncbi:MAG: aldehyde ferredoxin oxidoreductase family protein, partial [Anaerolineae bacterium]|nr:aldehyde ferredoxin oxidoreductase family protein [Anaerolineae bacterium]
MAGGFFGRVLWVDLTGGRVEEMPLPPQVYREHLGGHGLGVRLLLERMRPGADPLGPENVLGFFPGLLTGTGVPFSGRFMVVGKSPLTGGWGESNCGGHFGPALRSVGCDGLLVTGAADHPVCLVVGEEGVQVQDARDLWGLDTVQTEQRLRERLGAGAQVLCIGPAGERRALLAACITDGGRAAARSGLAAAMGAKGLKAVAVARGARRVPVHDPGELARWSRTYRAAFRHRRAPWPGLLFRLTRLAGPWLRRLRLKPSGGPTEAIIHVYREYGTCSGLAFSTEIGDAPVKNWRGVGARDFPLRRSARISDDAVIQHQVRRYACHACPVGCGGVVRLEDPRYGLQEGHKPEYETLAAFGPLVLNDDLPSIVAANNLCNRLGLDTISAGAAVAFALECAERGILSAGDAGGLDLTWGNGETVVALVEQMARREGLGALLADGVQRAAARLGGGAEAWAMHAGGQELPMHDSRYEPLLGIAYLADATPGRHNPANSGLYDVPSLREVLEWADVPLPSRYDYEAKGALFAWVNRYIQVVSSAGLCMFSLAMGRPPVREWLRAATGWDLDLGELLEVGHRIQVLRHAFNLREGIRPREVALPARAAGCPPLDEGPLEGVSLDVEAMWRGYCQAMGYDVATGMPAQGLVESLGIAGLAAGL